jgi:putative membrane protein
MREEFALWHLMHLFGTVLWIAVFVVLAWALVSWLSRRNAPMVGYHPTPTPTPPPMHFSALEILRQRYARGEIDDATFQHMRERLETPVEPEQQHYT